MFNLNGNRIGSEFRINTTTSNTQSYPSIATDKNNYFVTWDSYGQDGYSTGVYGQLFSSSGDKIGSEFQINSYTIYEQYNASISNNGYNYLVAWNSYGQDGYSTGVYGQLFSLSGDKIGSEFQINDYSYDSQYDPSISNNGCNYLVAWHSYLQDGSSSAVFGQLYNSEGNKIGSEFQINSYTLDSQINPAIGSNGNSFLVTWASYQQDGSGYGVYGQLLSSIGEKIGSEFQINSYTSDSQEYPSIACNGKNYFIAWESYGQDGYNDAVIGKIITIKSDPLNPDSDNDGLTDGDEVLIYLSDPTRYDSDGDGLLDKWEVDNNFNPAVHDSLIDNDNDDLSNLSELQNGTDVNNPDSDNDGLTDGAEVNNHNSNPLETDTDNDGLTDGEEVLSYGTYAYTPDTDGDTLTDYDELFVYLTNPLDSDTDSDGINDNIEIDNNLDPLTNDSVLDADNDGLCNLDEVNANTDINNPDSDNDGLLDGQEISPYGTNPLSPDSDNDGLTDISEIFDHLTDPLNPDSDGDTMFDGWEIANNLNPLSPDDALLDPDNDGIINKKEFFFGSSIYLADTDNDGLDDSLEILDFSSEFQINATTSLNQSAPSVACNGNNYLVVWESEGYYNRNINAQFYDKQGNKIGSEFRVNTYTTDYQLASNVITDGVNYFITWQSYEQDGDGYGVYGKILDEQGQ